MGKNGNPKMKMMVPTAVFCGSLVVSIIIPQSVLAGEHTERMAPKVVQEMQCGSHKVVIPCGKPTQKENDESDNSVLCYNNSLKVVDAKGRAKLVPGFGKNGSSAESVVCGVGRSGRHYMEVLSQSCWRHCDNDYHLLGENGSYIASKPESTADDSGDADAQHYDQFVAKNKVHFRHHPAEIVDLMQCGSHRVVISCGKVRAGEKPEDSNDARICVHNTLKFINAKGKTYVPKYSPKPRVGDYGYTPASMGCGRGKGGEYYVAVGYTWCSAASCETTELFTEGGVPVVNMQREYRGYLRLKREKKFRIWYR